MPRRSTFTIELTEAERISLDTMARRYKSPYREVIRAKIILYAARGLQNDEIAHRLDTPRQIVSKWRKRFFQERLLGLEERSRRGRPARFPPRVIMEVKALACEMPSVHGIPLSRFSMEELKREIRARGLVATFGQSTLWRWLSQDAIAAAKF